MNPEAASSSSNPSPLPNQVLIEKILAALKQKGLRTTGQRKTIIQAAFSTQEHYTAEELLQRAKAIDSSISRATVYRTIDVLVESGFLGQLNLGDAFHRYDPNSADHPNHNHIICSDCGKIVEFEDPCINLREVALVSNLGFQAQSTHVCIQAKCKSLEQEGGCPEKETGENIEKKA